MSTLQTIQIAVLVIRLLKKRDLTVFDIVEAVLPYVDSQVSGDEAKAISELVSVIIE